MNFKSAVHFHEELPAGIFAEDVVVVDDRLLNLNTEVSSWLKNFPSQYPVSAGEGLKDLHLFPEHVEKVLALVDESGKGKPTITAIGGGSVGDFAGFLASVLKRGLPFKQVPSTFLAAIDSAHGGKTALNSRMGKNQIGSFYPAKDIHIIRPLLEGLESSHLEDAYGELFKMALLVGGELWEKLKKAKTLDFALIWDLLPQAIEGKYSFVERDPFEKAGVRFALNLGHTLGHVWETSLGISHGKAVGAGIGFALEYSRSKGVLEKSVYDEILHSGGYVLLTQLLQKVKLELLDKDMALGLLRKDKKRAEQSQVHFVFVKTPGEYEIHPIRFGELVDEMQRQGFIA